MCLYRRGQSWKREKRYNWIENQDKIKRKKKRKDDEGRDIHSSTKNV